MKPLENKQGILSRIVGSKITTVVMICFALLCAVAAWVLREKETTLRLAPIYTGYYWGDESFFGRHWVRVSAEEDSSGHWEAEINGAGWNRYRRFYPDGTLHAEGEMYIDLGETNAGEPVPNEHLVKWGKYYRPDGTQGSEIRAGTGVQTLWFPDGQIRWRLELKDYKRVKHEMWSADGKLISSPTYDEKGVEVYLSEEELERENQRHNE